MIQEQRHEFTNRTVRIGIFALCVAGITLCMFALMPTASAATATETASQATNQAGGTIGTGVTRWGLILVTLLGALTAVGYVGTKGYAIVQSSKQ